MINHKKIITPSEWITQAIKEPQKDWNDTHFDVFTNYNNPQGLELLKYACQVLTEAKDAINYLENVDRSFMPVIWLPLGWLESFKRWDDIFWDKLGVDAEPPTLYILTDKDSFPARKLKMEQYHSPISFPSGFSFKSKNKIISLFSCCRNLEYEEYNFGVFLYLEGDF